MQQSARRWLKQRRSEDIQRTKSHTQLAQKRAHFLGQMFEACHFAANHTARIDQRDQQRASLATGLRIARSLCQFAKRRERLKLFAKPFDQARLQLCLGRPRATHRFRGRIPTAAQRNHLARRYPPAFDCANGSRRARSKAL